MQPLEDAKELILAEHPGARVNTLKCFQICCQLKFIQMELVVRLHYFCFYKLYKCYVNIYISTVRLVFQDMAFTTKSVQVFVKVFSKAILHFIQLRHFSIFQKGREHTLAKHEMTFFLHLVQSQECSPHPAPKLCPWLRSVAFINNFFISRLLQFYNLFILHKMLS